MAFIHWINLLVCFHSGPCVHASTARNEEEKTNKNQQNGFYVQMQIISQNIEHRMWWNFLPRLVMREKNPLKEVSIFVQFTLCSMFFFSLSISFLVISLIFVIVNKVNPLKLDMILFCFQCSAFLFCFCLLSLISPSYSIYFVPFITNISPAIRPPNSSFHCNWSLLLFCLVFVWIAFWHSTSSLHNEQNPRN